MRYAVLSDVHGNLEALTAVLDALAPERIGQYVCLGDIVGYGADPAACLQRLDATHAVLVGGNHDVACVGRFDLDWFNETARQALVWTRDQLNFTDLDRLRRLPLTETVGPLTLVHGTLRHPERFDYLVDLAQAVDTLAACRTPICLIGHTHVPAFVEYDRSERRVLRVLTTPQELARVTFQAACDTRRYLINPGSVGQPRDGDPRASCAIIDLERGACAIRRVAYDVAAAQRKIREAGLPAFLADRLAIGR
jgi:diadenosine tetraphosphatase ApaH/serine/threonine PP2A family protein phosphatase